MKLPKARRNDIVVQTMPGRTVLFDLETQSAHALSESMTQLWKLCDGKTALAELGRKVGDATGTPISEVHVRRALDSLAKVNLVSNWSPRVAPPRPPRVVSRRAALGGVTALFTIATLLSPSLEEEAWASASFLAKNNGEP